MTWFDWYVQVASTTAALLAWAFVLTYGIRSPWRANVVGRSLMYVWLSLAVVLTLICTSFIFGDYWFRPAVRIVVYSLLPVAFARFLVILLRVQSGRVRGEIPSRRVDGRL